MQEQQNQVGMYSCATAFWKVQSDLTDMVEIKLLHFLIFHITKKSWRRESEAIKGNSSLAEVFLSLSLIGFWECSLFICSEILVESEFDKASITNVVVDFFKHLDDVLTNLRHLGKERGGKNRRNEYFLCVQTSLLWSPFWVSVDSKSWFEQFLCYEFQICPARWPPSCPCDWIIIIIDNNDNNNNSSLATILSLWLKKPRQLTIPRSAKNCSRYFQPPLSFLILLLSCNNLKSYLHRQKNIHGKIKLDLCQVKDDISPFQCPNCTPISPAVLSAADRNRCWSRREVTIVVINFISI